MSWYSLYVGNDPLYRNNHKLLEIKVTIRKTLDITNVMTEFLLNMTSLTGWWWGVCGV